MQIALQIVIEFFSFPMHESILQPIPVDRGATIYN
jgi:hypothetical protein